MLDAARERRDTHAPSGGVDLHPAQHLPETQLTSGRVKPLPLGQRNVDTQSPSAQGDLPTPSVPATTNMWPASADLPPGQEHHATQSGIAGGDSSSADQGTNDSQCELVGGTPHEALLFVLADVLADLEHGRVANENRLRAHEQGKGLDDGRLADSRAARTMARITDALGELEHAATLELNRAMRAHPLGPWVKRTVGIGEKQGARLLAAIGDPYIKPAMYNEHGELVAPARPRLVSELWQYCGHGAPSKRQRGVKSWWNPTAKMRLHLVADKVVQAGVRKLDGWDDSNGYDFEHRTAISPLGGVYLAARCDWATRDTSDGHKHNHALRMVGKAILLDLWREAHVLHEAEAAALLEESCTAAALDREVTA